MCQKGAGSLMCQKGGVVLTEPSGWDKAEATLLQAFDWLAWFATLLFVGLTIVKHAWSPWGWLAVLSFMSCLLSGAGAARARKEINRMRHGS